MFLKMRRFLRGRSRKGLTLIELAIVLMVLGIIMGIVFYSLRDSTGVIDSAKKLKVQQQAAMLPIELQKFYDAGGSINLGDDLRILTEEIPDSSFRGAKEDLILDPWNRPYFICQADDGNDRICSRGADGQDGGEGQNADFQLDDDHTWPAWLKKK